LGVTVAPEPPIPLSDFDDYGRAHDDQDDKAGSNRTQPSLAEWNESMQDYLEYEEEQSSVSGGAAEPNLPVTAGVTHLKGHDDMLATLDQLADEDGSAMPRARATESLAASAAPKPINMRDAIASAFQSMSGLTARQDDQDHDPLMSELKTPRRYST
jgi:hypothetical protein